MCLSPRRPPRPDLPPELIEELARIPLDTLINMHGQPTGAERFVIRVFNQIITRDQLTTWIVWKAADDAWRATRLYRVIFTAMVAAIIGAVAAIIAAVEGWLALKG
jgi:hypothetical protein